MAICGVYGHHKTILSAKDWRTDSASNSESCLVEIEALMLVINLE